MGRNFVSSRICKKKRVKKTKNRAVRIITYGTIVDFFFFFHDIRGDVYTDEIIKRVVYFIFFFFCYLILKPSGHHARVLVKKKKPKSTNNYNDYYVNKTFF